MILDAISNMISTNSLYKLCFTYNNQAQMTNFIFKICPQGFL